MAKIRICRKCFQLLYILYAKDIKHEKHWVISNLSEHLEHEKKGI
jgi:hypothetical protein